jgi:hypothetical protein
VDQFGFSQKSDAISIGVGGSPLHQIHQKLPQPGFGCAVASRLYLIVGYSKAVAGLLQLSSEPMRVALAQIDGNN